MRAGNGKGVLSEINVTPLVDVMLVLLVIFMATAPLLKQGTEIDLPKAQGKDISSGDRLVIVLSKDGAIRLNDIPVSMTELSDRIRNSDNANSEAYLEADTGASYGEVVRLMAEIKNAGIEKLGLITEPIAQTK